MITGLRRNWAIWLFLIAITAAVYSRVSTFDFVDYDDQQYVVQNLNIKGGLTAQSLTWALTKQYDANWMPLVWVSFMIDHEMGGEASEENPAPYHRTNLVLHTLNALLLFALLNSLTGSRWRSAFVAALFAVHPMHVQSVAWVAERKDVLSTFLMLLTMLAYVRYARKPRVGRYLLVVLAFALGLMAKSMLVTLPILLLLLDFWPLRRTVGTPPWKLILEKTPLLAMAAAVGVVTVVQQQAAGALSNLTAYPIGVRLANAAVSYVAYVFAMVVPTRLAVFYPHPGTSIPVGQVVGSAALLAMITTAAVKLAWKRPYVTVGWLWYLITLLPVIGIVQVGDQAMADRYTYIPFIGLFVMVAWGVPDALGRLAVRKVAMVALAGISLLALGSIAYREVGYWRDSRALFGRAVEVAKPNAFTHFCLAQFLDRKGDVFAAAGEYRMTLRLDPDHGNAANNLAWTLATEHDPRLYNPTEAVQWAKVACEVTEYRRPEILDTLVVAYMAAGRRVEAASIGAKAIKLAQRDGNTGLVRQIRHDLAL